MRFLGMAHPPSEQVRRSVRAASATNSLAPGPNASSRSSNEGTASGVISFGRSTAVCVACAAVTAVAGTGGLAASSAARNA